MSERALLAVENLKTYFPIQTGITKWNSRYVHAVDDVSFEIYKGETLGIVGESGCGKTTLGRTICRLIDAYSGAVRLDDEDIMGFDKRKLDRLRQRMQMIFQDPYSSLNPRKSVRQILEEPLKIHRKLSAAERFVKIKQMMEEVGLQAEQLNRFPHQFSGGQRQRIGIARAMMLQPEIVICDEAVSALDVSVQSQVLNLLRSLREKQRLTYLFISHDLSVVRYISDRIVIMYLGKIVEEGETANFFAEPLHPYSQGLLASIPIPDPKLRKHMRSLEGDIPSPTNPPKGCRFNTRCPRAVSRCFSEEPILKSVKRNSRRRVACHLIDA